MTERYAITEAGALALRLTEFEAFLRRTEQKAADLHHYAQGVSGRPNPMEWMLILEQIAEILDDYRSANTHGRGGAPVEPA